MPAISLIILIEVKSDSDTILANTNLGIRGKAQIIPACDEIETALHNPRELLRIRRRKPKSSTVSYEIYLLIR